MSRIVQVSRWWLWLLLPVLLVGGLWWWLEGNVCGLPISYRVGHLDERFGLEREELLAAMHEAEEFWENASGQNLLHYEPDDECGVAVNLVYDERQSATQELEQLRSERERLRNELDTIGDRYQELRDVYDRQATAITGLKADYDERRRLFEMSVRAWNERGGAPADTYAELQQEQERLDAYVTELNALIADQNELAERLNELASEGQERVSGFNSGVDQFNESYVSGEDDEQGVYGSGTINVYQFDDWEDLVLLLVHEFGHALGVGHDQNLQSVMYPRKDDRQRESGQVFVPPETIGGLQRRCNLKPFSGHD